MPPGSAKRCSTLSCPRTTSDVARLTALQQDIHQSFKEHVRRRRAGKIDGEDESLFSGDVVTGRMALERGLIDGIGELRAVMRARYGDKVRLRAVAAERRRWPFPSRSAVCRTRARLAASRRLPTGSRCA